MADMFGGMSTTAGRRKGKTGEKGASAGPAPPAVDAVDPEKEKKELQLKKDAELRGRLERFYGYYNPGKLEAIDKTVDMFRGNEAKLWEMLGTKYGKEPTDEMIAKQQAEHAAKAERDAKTTGKSAGANTIIKRRPAATGGAAAATATATATGAAPLPTSFDSGSGFGGDISVAVDSFAEAPAGWGATDEGAVSGAGGGGGFGFGGGDGGASAGWGDTSGGAGGGFGFGNVGDGSSVLPAGAGGGFGFGDIPAAPSSSAGGGGGGFSFGNAGGGAATSDSSANNGGGFAFGSLPAAPSADGGFGFTSAGDDATKQQQLQQDEKQSSFSRNKKKESDSDDDEDSVVEKLDKRVSQALNDLTAKRDSLTAVILQLHDAVAERRQALQQCAKLEALVDEYTSEEQFEKAEEAHGQLLEAAKRVAACDVAWLGGVAQLGPLSEEARASINSGSRTFSEERMTLVQVRAEEERKIKTYITDATHKVETASQRIKVDLDKAVRAQSHVEQDLEELHKRKREIEAKIEEQTKGLRAEKDKVSGDAARLSSEIADLEKLLATKKRQLADKEANLDDINHKLSLVNKNHQEVMNSVLDSMKEEELNLRVYKTRVDDITEQKRQNEEETSSLQQEKKVMERELEQHAGKIALLERQSQTLATEVAIGFNSFFKKVVKAATETRGKEGKFCLLVPYTVPGAEEETTTSTSASAAAAGDAVYEPSSPGGSEAAAASLALQTLKAQINRLEQQLNLKTDEDATLMRRQQDINRSIPSLEAAKKQAAAAKQFKEASAKTAELKALTEELDEIAAKSKALADEMKAIKKELDRVEAQKLQEAKRYRSSMRHFTDKYSATLRSALNSADGADALSLLGVGQMLDLSAQQDSPKKAAEKDAAQLRGAVRKLIDVLFQELAAVCEVPEDQLRADPTGESNSNNSKSGTASPVTQNSPRGFGSADDAATSSPVNNRKSPSPEATAIDAGFEEQPAGGFNFGAAAAADDGSSSAAAAVVMTKEELQSKLEELNRAQEEAAAAENYELCEELQQKIDAIEAEIAKA